MAISLSYRHDLPELVPGAKRTSGQLTAPLDHSDFVLNAMRQQLGLGKGELCRLVGRRQENAQKWFDGSNSPSQAYWVRINYVQTLALSGINLKRIRTIDWSEIPFKIEWHKGAEPKEEGDDAANHRAKGKDAVRNAWGDIPKA